MGIEEREFYKPSLSIFPPPFASRFSSTTYTAAKGLISTMFEGQQQCIFSCYCSPKFPKWRGLKILSLFAMLFFGGFFIMLIYYYCYKLVAWYSFCLL